MAERPHVLSKDCWCRPTVASFHTQAHWDAVLEAEGLPAELPSTRSHPKVRRAAETARRRQRR